MQELKPSSGRVPRPDHDSDFQLAVPIEKILANHDPDQTLAEEARLVVEAIHGHENGLADTFCNEYRSLISKEMANSLAFQELVAGGADYLRSKFESPRSQWWADMAGEYACQSFRSGQTVSHYFAAIAHTYGKVRRLIAASKLDEVSGERAQSAVIRIALLEAHIMLSTIARLKAQEAAEVRAQHAEVFQKRLSAQIEEASQLGSELRVEAAHTSSDTRAMLKRTAKVADSAEHSAEAMGGAASTARGLINSIYSAIAEVEKAVEGAERASKDVAEAESASRALSDHTKSVESILKLIRSVASQTRLLALNATMEAARAGMAGRGFAVVAQEINHLSGQTARAVDEIANELIASKTATGRAISINTAIASRVQEVHDSAIRIREVMEFQKETVTSIIVVVDETALSAQGISTTTDAMRDDTNEVAVAIDRLENGFDMMTSALASLQAAANEYAELVS